MDKTQLYNSVLSDIGNLALVIFGFSVTLFTVLYSFIIAKREQLIEYSDKIKDGSRDILIIQRQSNAIKFIKKFKAFNKHLIVIFFIDLLIYIFCMALKYLVNDISIKEKTTWALIIIVSFIIGYVFIILLVTIKNYLKIIKI